MDNPADALLALSNTAAAIADADDVLEDDRSSSLSELDDAPDNTNVDQDLIDEDDDDLSSEDEIGTESRLVQPHSENTNMHDGDSEAETERLEDSPDKLRKSTFEISPSKLAQATTASDDVRPEIEELTNSDVSSPMTPVEDSPMDELSEAEDLDNMVLPQSASSLNLMFPGTGVPTKRKRLSDVIDIASDERPRKRRSQSLSDVEDMSEAESEPDKPELPTRDPSIEPEAPALRTQHDPEPEQAEASASDDSKIKKPDQYTRSRSRRGKDPAQPDNGEDERDHDLEASDEDEVEAEAEADDVDMAAKNEEEHAKRVAAMEALTILEKHYAALRDKLYDERISQVNHELNQIINAQSDHPELRKQFDCVNKYRDEKQETEQTLLVFKVGALKRKSVAERSTIHSSYFQSIRDTRERHMESMSEHFYRIQRERFKSSHVSSTYTIPFPITKATQVTQQLAYNKEVSILSGVAKYVGFPSAPDLTATTNTDLDADLQKMGITSTVVRIRNAASRHAALTSYPNPNTGATSALSTSAAAASASSEQQFIESTPWANPNHPIHRLGRQAANKSPFAVDHNYSQSAITTTPAHQQKRNVYTPQPVGSASTILEHPSAQPTPGTDLPSSALKQEPGTILTNGISATTINGSMNSISPTETRRTINNMLQASGAPSQAHPLNHMDTHSAYIGVNSSPLQARASLLSSLNRTASAAGMREGTRSPFRTDLIASGGMGRFGFR